MVNGQPLQRSVLAGRESCSSGHKGWYWPSHQHGMSAKRRCSGRQPRGGQARSERRNQSPVSREAEDSSQGHCGADAQKHVPPDDTTRRRPFWSLAEPPSTVNVTTSSKHAAQLQLGRVGHVRYVIVLHPIARTAHSPHADQSVFGNIDFDPNDYANAVLAGEPYPAQPGKSKPLKSAGLSPANEDISVAIGKLNVGLDDVEKQLKSVVSIMCVLRRFPCPDADEIRRRSRNTTRNFWCRPPV